MLKRRKFVQISGLSMCVAALPAVGNASNLLQKGTLEMHLTGAERRFLRAAQAEIATDIETSYSPKQLAKMMLYPVDTPTREGEVLTYHNSSGQLVKIQKKKGKYSLTFLLG